MANSTGSDEVRGFQVRLMMLVHWHFANSEAVYQLKHLPPLARAGLNQSQRDRALNLLKRGRFNVLVAAWRGCFVSQLCL